MFNNNTSFNTLALRQQAQLKMEPVVATVVEEIEANALTTTEDSFKSAPADTKPAISFETKQNFSDASFNSYSQIMSARLKQAQGSNHGYAAIQGEITHNADGSESAVFGGKVFTGKFRKGVG